MLTSVACCFTYTLGILGLTTASFSGCIFWKEHPYFIFPYLSKHEISVFPMNFGNVEERVTTGFRIQPAVAFEARN